MCISEPLPPATYAQRVMRNIRDVAVPSDNNPDNVDIHAAALTNQPLDNDFLTAATRQLEHTALGLRLSIPGVLIDQQHELVEQRFEFHEIFKVFVQRREDRPSRAPTAAMRALMRNWLQSIEDFPDRVNELGEPPSLGPRFHTMVREHMPLKLDFQSWVGQIAFNKLANTNTSLTGSFVMWDPSFHTVTLRGYKPFLGTGGEGRPVWRQNQYGVRIATNARDQKLHDRIEKLIRECEESLLSQSAQIANWVGFWIFDSHAHPLVHERERRGLDGYDLAMAVVEILGNEFFELPFDDEGRLQGWKMVRSLSMDEEDYFHVMEN